MHQLINVLDQQAGQYWFGWLCHTCGARGGSFTPAMRDRQKHDHQSAALVGNTPSLTRGQRERRTVTEPTVSTQTYIICSRWAGACELPGHSLVLPLGQNAYDLFQATTEDKKLRFAAEHQLHETKAQHAQTMQNLLENYKREVRRTAMRYARENDWCSTVEDALKEVGIDVDSNRKWVTVAFSMLLNGDAMTEDGLELTRENADKRYISQDLEDAEITLNLGQIGEHIEDTTSVSVVHVGDRAPYLGRPEVQRAVEEVLNGNL